MCDACVIYGMGDIVHKMLLRKIPKEEISW